MASPYFGGGGGDPFGRGSSPYFGGSGKDPFGRGAAAPKKSKGGILGHLVEDVGSTLKNIVPGAIHAVEHPGRAAKAIGHSYAQTYGPLFAGHVGKFFHGVEQHPLGPILDLATVATLGAGGVARAGEILAKAGVVSDAGKLANLGKAADLTAPDFAKVAGQKGEDILIKKTSKNPLIRTRQKAVNDLLNRLPESTPMLGSSARVLKAFARGPERARAQLLIEAQPFKQAFDKLTNSEKAAWHLAARGVHPLEYAAHLARQDGPVSAHTAKLLTDPEIERLVVAPTKNLSDALTKGEALSHSLTQLKLRAGHISEQSAAEAPYRLQRLIRGATIDEHGIVDQPGHSVEQIAHELHTNGRPQPFYVPDSAETGGRGSKFNRKPTGLADPAVSGSSKQNLGVLANRGLLAMNENPLVREFLKFGHHTEASLLHDELVKHAAELPKGVALPPGYEYLKLNRGEATAPYTERVAGKFEHALAPGTADNVLTHDETADVATSAAGHRLIVPSSVRQVLENQTLTYHGALHKLLYSHPTSIWKHLVLGLRPAFFTNITVGNSILGALQMAPGRHGLAGWLNQVVPGAEKALGSKLDKTTFADVFPEQAVGSFGHSTGFTSNKGLSLAQRGYQGVMPATIAYENVLRRAMAEGWAKATPQVRAEMKRNGGDVNAALRAVAASHPEIVDEISKRIDDALGNYRRYNAFEQKVKQLIPFYGWDRHIARSTARLGSERPGTVNALTKVGAVGAQQEHDTLGDLPAYMQGSVKLGDLAGLLGAANGRTNILSTHSLDPFTTVGELATIPEALTGKAGVGSEVLSSGLNPIVQALIEQMTGRSLLSGAPVARNAFVNTAENIPQAALIAALLGHGKKPKPTSLYDNNARVKLANLLGLPVKKANLQTAHLYASESK